MAHAGAVRPVILQLLLLLQVAGIRVPTAAGWLRWRQRECRCGSCGCARSAYSLVTLLHPLAVLPAELLHSCLWMVTLFQASRAAPSHEYLTTALLLSIRKFEQTAHIRRPILTTGCGAEAAIGQLTRLTSLHMSIDRSIPYRNVPPGGMPHGLQRLTRQQRNMHGVPLQLQHLGCSETPHIAGGSRRSSSNGSGGSAADSTSRNTSLQELSLECMGPLSDDELSAAARAMPDLRRLDVVGCICGQYALAGLFGARLAAFSACRRLRDISLRNAPNLDGRQLVRQLLQICSLASLQVRDCPGVNSKAVGELQAAFQAEHGRHLSVDFEPAIDEVQT